MDRKKKKKKKTTDINMNYGIGRNLNLKIYTLEYKDIFSFSKRKGKGVFFYEVVLINSEKGSSFSYLSYFVFGVLKKKFRTAGMGN